MKHAHVVITGEGQSDEQTLYGKVPFYVGQLAKQYDVPAFYCLVASVTDLKNCMNILLAAMRLRQNR